MFSTKNNLNYYIVIRSHDFSYKKKSTKVTNYFKNGWCEPCDRWLLVNKKMILVMNPNEN